mgnify:CR=1 FL=1
MFKSLKNINYKKTSRKKSNSPFDSAKQYSQPHVLFSPDRRSLNLLNRNHGDCLHHQRGPHLRQKPTLFCAMDDQLSIREHMLYEL